MARHDESRRRFIKTVGIGAAGVALNGMAQAGEKEMKDGIPYRPLGRTGLKVPAITFGAMGIRSTNANVLRAGLAQGLIYIDTARSYGSGASEEVIGEVVESFGRDKVLIHTKASGAMGGDVFSQSDEEVEKDIRKALESSLRSLRTDYIDTYVCPHGASDPKSIVLPQLQKAVEKFKQEGKIRFFGVSTHTNYDECSRAAIHSGFHDFIMPSVSVLNLDPDFMAAGDPGEEEGGRGRRPLQMLDLREACKAAQEKQVGVMAMKCLRYPKGARAFGAIREKYAPDGQEISNAQLCYRYILGQPFVSTMTVGIQNMHHLEEALALPALKLNQPEQVPEASETED